VNNIYIVGDTINGQMRIVKLNDNFQVQWVKGPDAPTITNAITGTIIRCKGNQLVCSGRSNSSTSIFNTSINGEQFIMSLDLNGNLNWIRKYICNTTFKSFDIGSDKSICGIGTAPTNFSFQGANYYNTSNDIWVVKLDSVGEPEWSAVCGTSNADFGYDI
jgi:hypothetical protein